MAVRTSLPLHATEEGGRPCPPHCHPTHKQKDKHQKTTYKRGKWRKTKKCRKVRKGSGWAQVCEKKRTSNIA